LKKITVKYFFIIAFLVICAIFGMFYFHVCLNNLVSIHNNFINQRKIKPSNFRLTLFNSFETLYKTPKSNKEKSLIFIPPKASKFWHWVDNTYMGGLNMIMVPALTGVALIDTISPKPCDKGSCLAFVQAYGYDIMDHNRIRKNAVLLQGNDSKLCSKITADGYNTVFILQNTGHFRKVKCGT
jgi:hypothetical protein